MPTEELDIIETPENVDLQRRLAGIGSRFLAGLLDSLLIVGLLLVPVLIFLMFDLHTFFLGGGAEDEVGTWMIAILIVVAFLIYWGYFLLFELWMNGQTPGKRYMRIRVVQQEGAAVSFDSIAVRNLLRAVDGLGMYAVAGIVMFATRKMQRLGDLAAGTVVISEEIPDYSARQDKKQKVLDDAPVTAAVLQETHLTPHEYRLLHSYWLRSDQLTLEARAQLLPKLLRPILERTGTVPPHSSLATLEEHLDELMSHSGAIRPNAPSDKPPEASP